MKRMVVILLVGLLGFLGCSGSDEGTAISTGQATPVAPFGNTDSITPTYEWTPVQYATRYRLLVQDAIQDSSTQDSAETYLIDEWYTAGEAGCDSEDGLCMVTPDTEVRGKYNWMVIACVGDNCGISSDALPFSAGKTMVPVVLARFSDFGDGTVLDNNTKLMWTKDASPVLRYAWGYHYCKDLIYAGYDDWHLPSLAELNSLIDRSQLAPALPPDHPFINVQLDYYWSSTYYDPNPNKIWSVSMVNGLMIYTYDDGVVYGVWPVRWGGKIDIE